LTNLKSEKNVVNLSIIYSHTGGFSIRTPGKDKILSFIP